jgi:hypothetical protein
VMNIVDRLTTQIAIPSKNKDGQINELTYTQGLERVL